MGSVILNTLVWCVCVWVGVTQQGCWTWGGAHSAELLAVGRGSLSRAAAFPNRMVLCIAAQDSHSLSHLSLRFGASLKSCRHLLENAKKSHVEVVGVRCALGAGHPAHT